MGYNSLRIDRDAQKSQTFLGKDVPSFFCILYTEVLATVCPWCQSLTSYKDRVRAPDVAATDSALADQLQHFNISIPPESLRELLEIYCQH